MQIKQWQEKLFTSAYKEISPLEFGMTQDEVINALGAPDVISFGTPPLILKYGSIEVHFDKQNDYKLFLVYSDENEYLSIKYEPSLYSKLGILLHELSDNSEGYSHIFSDGYKLLSDYKAGGGTQGNAFNTVHHLYMDNRRAGGESAECREDLIGEWLDCLCGWIGNYDLVIW